MRLAETSGRQLSDLTATELRTLHPKFEDDVVKVWSYENSVESRNAEGGTSKKTVLQQVDKLRVWLATQPQPQQ